ncbi:MAG: hypothetical protein K9W43_04315 [Candidatus Thorarchaeota archaeon]|nr:hypothetical protein [Candidatus Thorarchaeota archaeon]
MASKSIQFKRKITIEKWSVNLTLKEYVDNPIWLAILELAYEHKRHVTPAILHTQLLKRKLPIKSAKLLIERLVELGLLDNKYKLTEEGLETYESKRIPDPQTGTYTIKFARDSLLPQIIVDCEGPFPPRFDKRRINKTQITTDEIDTLLFDTIGKTIIVGASSKPIQIMEVKERGTKLDTEYATLQLMYYPDKSPELLLIQSDSKGINMPIPKKLASLKFKEICNIVYSQINGWDRKTEKVLVPFKGLEPSERRTFRKRFTIKRPTIPDYGTFNSVLTPPLNIEPQSSADAQEWIDWYIEDQLPPTYLRSQTYAKFITKVKHTFPTRYDVTIPDRHTLARKLMKTNRTKGWLLQAPIDLLLR